MSAHRSDAPAVCLLFCVIAVVAALVAAYGWRLDVVQRDKLQRVSGRVESVLHTHAPKGGPKLHIEISDGTRAYYLTQDDLTCRVPALKTVERGDSVVAYAYPDALGRNIYWLWGLERGGQVLLSYEDTYAFLAGEGEMLRPVALPSALIAVGLFAVGVFLRQRYGAWKR